MPAVMARCDSPRTTLAHAAEPDRACSAPGWVCAEPADAARAPARTDALALTFDDGPDPLWTPRVFDALADAEAKATFFVIAGRAAHQQLLGRMLREGSHGRRALHHDPRSGLYGAGTGDDAACLGPRDRARMNSAMSLVGRELDAVRDTIAGDAFPAAAMDLLECGGPSARCPRRSARGSTSS